MAKTLAGSKTYQNLKDAFAEAAQTRLNYLAFAKVADTVGHPDISQLFKVSAQEKAGQANGHQAYLKTVGSSDELQPDKGSEVQPKDNEANLKSAIASCTRLYETTLPEMQKVAEAEGFDDVSEWFFTAAKQDKTSAGRFKKALELLNF